MVVASSSRTSACRVRRHAVPVADDTIWRLYSMTKPITGVALMTLYEHGLFQLSDPVHRFIPEWRTSRCARANELVEPHRPVTVRDVMMHMGGIGYGPGNADLDPGILGSAPGSSGSRASRR